MIDVEAILSTHIHMLMLSYLSLLHLDVEIYQIEFDNFNFLKVIFILSITIRKRLKMFLVNGHCHTLCRMTFKETL